MKRSEMLVKMQRVHAIRYVMVESGHITLEQFMGEMLQMQESLGMLPVRTELKSMPGTFDNAWDPEEVVWPKSN